MNVDGKWKAAFEAGFDVAFVKAYVDGSLHSCSVLGYMGWGGDRLASDLTRGLPWMLGARMQRSTYVAEGTFRGHMDEVALFAGTATEADIMRGTSGELPRTFLYPHPQEYANSTRCGVSSTGSSMGCSFGGME